MKTLLCSTDCVLLSVLEKFDLPKRDVGIFPGAPKKSLELSGNQIQSVLDMIKGKFVKW